ncbi:MAG: hypothetical protein ACLQPD_23010 [Desulfomonilaceae bacterium]
MFESVPARIIPKSIRLFHDELSGEIDKNIEPLVTLMRELGFNTISSCEGHFQKDNFKHLKPNIVFHAFDRGLLHAWIREVAKAPLALPVSFGMGPTWNPKTDVVHEDNWGIELDVTWCVDHKEAASMRDKTVAGLCAALRRAVQQLPLATDTFVRSRW